LVTKLAYAAEYSITPKNAQPSLLFNVFEFMNDLTKVHLLRSLLLGTNVIRNVYDNNILSECSLSRVQTDK